MKNQTQTRVRFFNFHVLLLPSFLSLFLSCGSADSPSGQHTSVTHAEGFQVRTSEYRVNIRSTGDLLSWERVELKAPVAGNVLAIHFQEGQHVNEGELLVQIDDRTWKAQKKGLEAQLFSAENELERKRQLLAVEGVSREEFDQSEARANHLKAQIDELKVRIDLARIHAPFTGRLGMRNFSRGAYLAQGDIVTHLVQADKIRVDFSIPSRYAPFAKEGMEVQVIPSSSGDTVTAEVYALEPAINTSSRSMHVRAKLDNPLYKYIPGDFARIVFEVGYDDQALLIPAESVIPEMDSQVVYRVKNGKAQRREIETGTRTRDKVHVLQGLTPGDTILVTGLMEIRDGTHVEITALKGEESL